MKKITHFILSICSIILTNEINAQVAVALHHNGSAQMFYGSQPFLNAYNAAVNGDTIYLPGFNFSSAQPSTINKSIHIFGTGHYPDSTQATKQTIISGFTLSTGADKSSFEGLTINGHIQFDTDIEIDSVVIRRNRITGNVYFNGTNTSTECKGVEINQNVMGFVDCSHASAVKIFNNIISTNYYYQGAAMNAKANTWVANNIVFLFHYCAGLYSCEFTLFENNILIPLNSGNSGANSNSNYCTFKNNIFFNDPTSDTYQTWNGNYLNQSTAALLVTASYGFNYTDNYHLQNPSSFLGSDRTEAGIYGGYKPYKEGVVPFNPHIQQKTISQSTDANGKLNINIQVGAQSK